jgi:hypothetical protein
LKRPCWNTWKLVVTWKLVQTWRATVNWKLRAVWHVSTLNTRKVGCMTGCSRAVKSTGLPSANQSWQWKSTYLVRQTTSPLEPSFIDIPLPCWILEGPKGTWCEARRWSALVSLD